MHSSHREQACDKPKIFCIIVAALIGKVCRFLVEISDRSIT